MGTLGSIRNDSSISIIGQGSVHGVSINIRRGQVSVGSLGSSWDSGSIIIGQGGDHGIITINR